MSRAPSLSSLRLFLQLAHARNFTDVARAANVSQPAISRTIRLLEQQLGVRLFDRTSRNVTLTAAGEALVPTVERLTADYDHAFQELAQTFSGRRGRVIVGALPSVAAGFLPRAIASFREANPGVEIILRDALSGSLHAQMAERRVDLAITSPPDAGEFHYEPLFQDRMMLVTTRDGAASGSPHVTWQSIADQPFIAMAAGSSVRALTDAAMANANLRARPLYECTLISTAAALIDAGLGVSALPHSTAPLLTGHDLVMCELVEPRVTRTIGVAWPIARTLPPAADAFLHHLLTAAPRGPLGGFMHQAD